MNDDQLKQLWKAQPTATAAISLDDLGVALKTLQRRVRVCNAMEYAACVFVLAGFAFYLVRFPFPLMRAGSVLVMIGTLVVAWQLHRRASSRALPADAGAQSWRAFQRARLVRQRDALRSVAWWYIAPFVPGVVVFRWGVETELDASAPFAQGWLANAIIAGVLLGIVALNRHAARGFQRRIDALDRDMP